MLKLLSSQTEGNRDIRDWYYSDQMDFIVWHNREKGITNYQICYGKPLDEHVLSWRGQTGFSHSKISDGEEVAGNYKAAPIERPDGEVDYQLILNAFESESEHIPNHFKAFALASLKNENA